VIKTIPTKHEKKTNLLRIDETRYLTLQVKITFAVLLGIINCRST